MKRSCSQTSKAPTPRLIAVAMFTVTSLACGSAPPRGQPQVASLPGGAHAAFAHYGTNPTIDTGEEATSRVGLAADQASMAIVRHYLSHGLLPPPEAVRVEDLVAATLSAMASLGADPDARAGVTPAAAPIGESSAIGLDVALVPSPFRAGWHAPVLAVTAPNTTSMSPIVVVSASLGPTEGAFAAGGARVERGGLDTLRGLLRGAARPRLVFVGDAAGLGGVEAQGALIDEVRRWRATGGTLSVLERLGPGTDDALLDRLALEGGGLHEVLVEDDLADPPRLAALTRRLCAPAGLSEATATLELDPNAVSRWRLVGMESRVARAVFQASGGLVPAGETVYLYYEVRLSAGTGHASLGTVSVLAREGSVRASLESRSNAVRDGRARAVVAAAAFAEKLRGSFWVRDLGWEVIAVEVARWAPSLSPWVARARSLESGRVEPGAETPIRAVRLLPTGNP